MPYHLASLFRSLRREKYAIALPFLTGFVPTALAIMLTKP